MRLRYATDAAFEERGWFADDFSVTGGGATTWSDDVEGGTNGWTTDGGHVRPDTTGAGWHIDPGTQVKAQYYLAEWRNFDGFDEGLKYAYDTTLPADDAWKVEKIKYNAPGMLVWYRDTDVRRRQPRHGERRTALPSYGPKGGLLIVDSPLRPAAARPAWRRTKDPSTLNNLPSRAQSSNAAFITAPDLPFKECLGEIDEADLRRRTARGSAGRAASTRSATPGRTTPGWSCAGSRCSSATSTPASCCRTAATRRTRRGSWTRRASS